MIEEKSTANLIQFFSKELIHAHQTRKTPDIPKGTLRFLKKTGYIGRRFQLSERALETINAVPAMQAEHIDDAISTNITKK